MSELGKTLVYNRRRRTTTVPMDPDELIRTNVYQRDAVADIHAAIAEILHVDEPTHPMDISEPEPEPGPGAAATRTPGLAERFHDVPQSWLLIAAFILSVDVVLGGAVLLSRMSGWPM